VQSARQTMRQGFSEKVWLAMQRESHVQAAQFASEDIAEGMKAMAERRPPAFPD